MTVFSTAWQIVDFHSIEKNCKSNIYVIGRLQIVLRVSLDSCLYYITKSLYHFFCLETTWPKEAPAL